MVTPSSSQERQRERADRRQPDGVQHAGEEAGPRMERPRDPRVPAARRREHLRQLRGVQRLQGQQRPAEQVSPRRHHRREAHDENERREDRERRRDRRDPLHQHPGEPDRVLPQLGLDGPRTRRAVVYCHRPSPFPVPYACRAIVPRSARVIPTFAVWPPSTANTAPVTYEASSEARKAAAAASSSGLARRPIGIAAPNLRISSSVITDPSIGVAVGPGAIAFTLIPSAAWSIASAFVSIATPPLEVT